MNLPRLSVQRPVFTVMVTLIVVILGAVALGRLQIDLLPDIEVPRMSIRTSYEGASPEVMERRVTQIVEEIVSTTPGIEEITSTSSEGNSRVRLSFAAGTDINASALEVLTRLEDELNEFPEDISRPSVSTFDVGSDPVVIVGISSTLDPVELTELVEREVRDRFGRVPGVAQVDPWGGYDREVRIEVDLDKLLALQVPLEAILQSIRDANLDTPTGRIDEARLEVTLRAPAEFRDLQELRGLVVAVRDGAAVTLGQIAEVRDTYAELTRIVRVNGDLGLRLAVRKESEANTVEVSEAILAEVARLNADFPQLTVVPVRNQGNFIERSITNVARSVLYGGSLAVVMLLLFLRDFRSTAVIAVAIPICVLATLAVMYVSGMTINLMTLGGLALGVGMMVDNSIVVLENIVRRYRELNEVPRDAAVRGTGEVAAAIIASTATTLVIFLPLIFLRGTVGMLFTEFAQVVAIALLCSLVLALTLVPMLASRMLRQVPSRAGSPKPSATQDTKITRHAITWREGYLTLLSRSLRNRALVVLSAIALLLGSALLVPWIGSEFLPASDEGELRVNGEMDVGMRLSLVDQQTRRLEAATLREVPEAMSWIVNVGASGWDPNAGSRGSISLRLMPATQRDRSNLQIADDLREKLVGTIPGMDVRVRAPSGQNVLNRVLPGGGGVRVEVRGPELDTLAALARRAADVVADVEGVEKANPPTVRGTPQRRLDIDRAKAADLGVTVRSISEALEAAVTGRQAGEFRAEGESHPIRVQLADARDLTVDQLLDLTVAGPEGDAIALRNAVTDASSRGPTAINRKDRQRLLSVEVDLGQRDAGSVAGDIEQALREIPKPEGYRFEIAGSYAEQQEAFRELLLSIGLALALVYMVLASQYESLRDPLVVMLTVPMAAVGVLLTLFLTNTTLNIQSYLGCIMLAGIVVNNAILVVDQAGRLQREERMDARRAATEAGRRRLRPILMTSLTTMLGLLPLALGIGEGADTQAPLARAVIGGLLVSMLVTLVLAPVAYTLVHPNVRVDPRPSLLPKASGQPA
ncbi:MAG: efflux RND transporter permease subunit [Planctomycetota bacterium]